jgi:hypothetical protein
VDTECVQRALSTLGPLPLDGAVSDALSQFDLAHIFDRLIIGPPLYPWSMLEAFTTALKNEMQGLQNLRSELFLAASP